MLCVLTVLGAPAAAQQPTLYKVIVNAVNPVTELTREEISRFFLRKTTRWPDGTQAFPVDLERESAVRAAFSLDVHGREVSVIKSYWHREVFEGSMPPPEVADDASMIDLVREQTGGIGYVSGEAGLGGVKDVRVLWRPRRTKYVEPEYPTLARRARVEGQVVLDVTVDTAGRVADVEVVEELGFGLTEQAIKAVEQWEYSPSTLDGEPTSVTFEVAINFEWR